MSEEELVRQYAKKVLIISRSYFLAGGDKDDLYQEGLIALLSAIRTYDQNKGVSFSTYAESCIKRRLIDTIRNNKYSGFLSIEDFDFDDIQISPEDSFLENEAYNNLLADIKTRLSRYESSVLNLYLSGYSHTEIAEKLNKPVESVYNAIQRIRQKIAANS